jgi:hypothetical protein
MRRQPVKSAALAVFMDSVSDIGVPRLGVGMTV